MRLPVERNLTLAALGLFLVSGCPALAQGRGADPSAPQSDYPVVIGQPYTMGGVTYTPADTLNYDVVGRAGVAPEGGDRISASHRTLPIPSYVEVTSLDTGRTILVRLERRGPMNAGLVTELSPGAAAMLGIAPGDRVAVRIRRVNPPEPERAALRSGRSAPARMDTPAPLRAVLLRRLDERGVGTQISRPGPMPMPAALPRSADSTPRPVQPTPATSPEPQPPERPSAGASKGGWIVQVGAYSSPARAAAVARPLKASVVPAGKIWRVRITGLGSEAAANAALANARAAGYTDARVQRAD